MDNYYDLLEISHTASEEVIRAAYKAKVKLWHPDNFQGEQEKEKATKNMHNLNKALEILTDIRRRRKYDEELKKFEEKGHKKREATMDSENDEELAEMLDRVQKMIVLTKNETEYLQLHRQIRQSNYPEREKRLMADALDYITAIRLEEEIQQADSLAFCKKEVSENRSGAIGIVVIGFILTAWISSAWWIAIILAVLGYIGGGDERKELKEAEQAEVRIQQYRLNGFRI